MDMKYACFGEWKSKCIYQYFVSRTEVLIYDKTLLRCIKI